MAFSTGFRIFGNVDGLADRTLDSLKACGFDKGRWGDAPVERWRLRHHQRAALAASRRQGGHPLADPSVCKGIRHGEGLRSSARRVS
jgi:hypothetical protein